MRIVYTQRWTSSITDDVLDEAAQVWARVLRGIDNGQLAAGVAKVEKSLDAWPPTPGQFRAMCLPDAAELGLPDRETAWQQAVGNVKLSHPVVWHVRERVGAWNLKNLPQASTRRKFDDAWGEAVAQAAAGATFGWPAGASSPGQLEDATRQAGHRGPTPASELALKTIRERWGGQRADPPAPAPETAAQGAQEA